MSGYRDANVSTKFSLPMFLIFPDIHGSREGRTDIVFNGKTYRNVRGLKPYYIAVPQLDSILFVTVGTNVTFHLARLDTKQVTHIDGGGSGFGTWIGWDSTYPPGVSNFVSSAVSNGLMLVTLNMATVNGQTRVTEYLDLRNKRLGERTAELIK